MWRQLTFGEHCIRVIVVCQTEEARKELTFPCPMVTGRKAHGKKSESTHNLSKLF